MKNLIFFPLNAKLDSFIKPRNKLKKSSNNKIMISPIPTNNIKNKKKKSINILGKESLSHKIFYDYSKNKTSTNNSSVSKEKSNKNYNNNEVLKQKDCSSLKKNIQMIKIEIDMINKMIKDNNKNLELLMEELKDLNKKKKIQQKIFENNLSQKETLEDICNTIINNIKNNNLTNINDDYYIEITIDDIKNNNKILYINKVFEVFNFINNYNDTKYLNYIRKIIDEAFSDFYSYINSNIIYNINNSINNLFIELSSKIISQIKYKTTEKAINLLLKFLLKINIINEIIHEVIHYLEHEYKDRKNDINDKIAEIEKKLESLQTQKNELISLKNNINEKINIISNKKTPFCEKTIYQKRLNRKELMLKNISTTIHFSTECIKKSNSNSIDKSNANTLTNNTFNNNKEDDIKQREILYRNMINFFSLKNKTNESSAHHSNRISIGKLHLKGKTGQCSNEKNKNKMKKNSYTKNNICFKKIDWTQKKDTINKNKVANGINNNIKERNFNFNIKEFSKFHHLTENNINNNLIKINQLNNRYNINKDNGKSINYDDKENINKTERIKVIDLNKSSNMKANSIDNNIIDESLKLIYKKEKYKLAKQISLYDINNKKQNNSISKKKNKNALSKYLSKNVTKDKNNCEQKIKKKKINKYIIYRMQNKTKALNDELRNNKKFKINTLEKKDKKTSNNQINYIKNYIDESFCFYKLLGDNSKLFNPLNNEQNLNKQGYCEGFISIDNISNCIKFTSKKRNNTINYDNIIKIQSENNTNKNNENIINIQLKDIIKVHLINLMKNIIKIHNIFLKYNVYNNPGNYNDISTKRFSNINELLNIREIMNIKDMEQSEKIKAGLCNFFSFILEFNNNNKIECILINYYQFNAWLEYLDIIVKNNVESKKILVNGNNSFTQNGNNLIKSKEFYLKLESNRTNKNIKKKKKTFNNRYFIEKTTFM